jgi:hypothetical protein
MTFLLRRTFDANLHPLANCDCEVAVSFSRADETISRQRLHFDYCEPQLVWRAWEASAMELSIYVLLVTFWTQRKAMPIGMDTANLVTGLQLSTAPISWTPLKR